VKNNDPFIINLKYDRFEYVRLLDDKKVFHNQIKTVDACRMADSVGLNLVCFNKPTDKELAFCKMVDFNKWKYEEEKARKKMEKQSKHCNKEMRFSPVIDDNDIGHKMKQVNEFLDEGNDVTLTMKLKGREKAHFPEAQAKMNKIVTMVDGHGKEVSRKKSESMIIVQVTKLSEKDKADRIDKMNKIKEEAV